MSFTDLELYGGEGYVPYESKDPLNDPKSFTFRYKVIENIIPTYLQDVITLD